MDTHTTQKHDIVLGTLIARYIHTAFGLRYLHANIGEDLQKRTLVREWMIQQPVPVILEDILELNPKILGLGVYIWNVEPMLRLVDALKRIRPDMIIVLGGPEVSYETEGQPIVELADYIITGEADVAFGELCRALLAGDTQQPKITRAALPSVPDLKLPYGLYDDEDVAHRIMYVEVSRGCPFRCEFCLSSLELPVRKFALEPFLEEMQRLLDRGVKQFKFVDRTFNLNLRVSQTILDFFYDRYTPGLFLHFEMIPDRFPEALRENVKRFPPGSLQFEVGIQTFCPDTCERISRRQNNQKLEENLSFLRAETGVHVHADLIAGLPGETLESFAEGFDHLLQLGPQEIQLGILKRLRGTPITRHDEEWDMVYSSFPPYDILQNQCIDFSTMQRIKRFAKFWDKYGNSGNFSRSLELLWSASEESPFWTFWSLSGWLFQRVQKTHSISLQRLMELLFTYLTDVELGPQLKKQEVAEVLWSDYQHVQSLKIPKFLKPFISKKRLQAPSVEDGAFGPAAVRQARHLKTSA